MEYQQFINWLRAKKVLKNYMREFDNFQDRLLSGEKIDASEYWIQQIRGKTVEEAFNIYIKATLFLIVLYGGIL